METSRHYLANETTLNRDTSLEWLILILSWFSKARQNNHTRPKTVKRLSQVDQRISKKNQKSFFKIKLPKIFPWQKKKGTEPIFPQ